MLIFLLQFLKQPRSTCFAIAKRYCTTLLVLPRFVFVILVFTLESEMSSCDLSQLNKEARSSHISRESDKVLQLAHRCYCCHTILVCSLLLKKAHLAPFCQRKMCDSTYNAMISTATKRLTTVISYESFPLLHTNTDGGTLLGILRSGEPR